MDIMKPSLGPKGLRMSINDVPAKKIERFHFNWGSSVTDGSPSPFKVISEFEVEQSPFDPHAL
jgi:hypothetical protein